MALAVAEREMTLGAPGKVASDPWPEQEPAAARRNIGQHGPRRTLPPSAASHSRQIGADLWCRGRVDVPERLPLFPLCVVTLAETLVDSGLAATLEAASTLFPDSRTEWPQRPGGLLLGIVTAA